MEKDVKRGYLSRVSHAISNFILNSHDDFSRLISEIEKSSVSEASKDCITKLFELPWLVEHEPCGIIQGGISFKYLSDRSIPLAYKDCFDNSSEVGCRGFILSEGFFKVGFNEPMEEFFYSKKKKCRIVCMALNTSHADATREGAMCPIISAYDFWGQDAVGLVKREIVSILAKTKDKKDSTRYRECANKLSKICKDNLLNVNINDARKIIRNFAQEVLKEELEGDEIAKLTETVLQSLIWNWVNGDRCRYIYYIADMVSDSSFSSGICLVTSRVLDEEFLESLALLIDRFFGSIYFAITLKRESLAHLHSAIGSIMSRNGSHNIGSHVLSSLSHNVGTMPDDRILYQYIQHRMDYIASATTGAPDWSVPTPFVGSVMKMFYSQRHLLDHIAESDGLRAYQYQGKGLQIGNGQKNCVKIVVRKTIHPNEYGVDAPTADDNGWDVVHREYAGDREKRDVYVYDFFPDKPKGLIDWSNDESLAIPGGVLGQHAFYNIVENILRNAAKHSWAGKEKKTREDAKNLEIYIDFEKWKTDGTMCFTVGDNMSELFSGRFWQAFFDKYPEMPFKFSKPLDGFVVPPDGQDKDGTYHSNRISLERFLNGERDASEDKLPSHYVELYKYIVSNWDNGSVLRDDKEFLSLLTGTDTNDPKSPNQKLGRRLPLPLHHRQEIALSQPFIDVETNRLRQTAWGLSEMKISAGYLRRSDVSVIGGLKNEPGRRPLIVPMGIPHLITKDTDQHGKVGCTSDGVLSKGISKKLCYKDLCLAYRFWIKLPKEVLIVTDDALAVNWKAKIKEWAGIDVMSYSSVFGEGGKNGDIGKMSDYGFVIVDHSIEVSDSLKSPFRTLWISNADAPMPTMPYVLRSRLENAGTRQELVECVYQAWLNYLKFKRCVRDENKDLTIRLKMSEKKDGEKGLVSDRDIYKVLFRECLHSVLEPLADKQIKDLDVPERQALLLLSLYPIDETDEMFGTKNVEEQFKAEGDYPIATRKLLGEVADRIRSILSGEPDAPNRPSRDRVLHAWRRGLENPGKEHLESIISPLLKFIHDETSSTPVPNGVIDVLSGMKECSRPSRALSASISSTLDLATQTLETARATSEVFLRKYEERITTLPRQYRGIGLPESETLHFSGFGVSVCYNETPVKADISYLRHSTDDAALYSEPLSGAQNYLNALSNLSHNDSQWAMRLAENGLLRIAVIDERVYKFISDHGKEVRKTYASMHIAVVDTGKKPCYKPEDAKFPDLEKLDFAIRNEIDADFDLVVVHQGIIDKWWPNNHGKENVAKILDSLRNPGGGAGIAFPRRFVVVTTGRGRPDNIPDTEKVLAFSSIEACLFKRYPEKLNLVNSLMGILPGSPERNDDNG